MRTIQRLKLPLHFSIGTLDSQHPWFSQYGLNPQTIEHFGLGYCSRGLMKGRIVAPLLDVDQQLIGYAGHAVHNDDVPLLVGLFPTGDDKTSDFSAGTSLYNVFNFTWSVHYLFVLQSIDMVWHLWQHDFVCLTAILTPHFCPQQAGVIQSAIRPDGHVTLITTRPQDAKALRRTFLQTVGERCWVSHRHYDGHVPFDDIDAIRRVG